MRKRNGRKNKSRRAKLRNQRSSNRTPRRARQNTKRATFAPTALNTNITNRGAMDKLTVTHREFVLDIISNGNGQQIQNLEINPGLTTAFPWLSTMAAGFETYSFNKLKYMFIPVVGTDTAGALAICPDYDAADNNSASKTELMSFQDTARGNLWSRLDMNCKASNLHKRKQYFTRLQALAGDMQDIKSYDALQLYLVISTAIAQDLTIGELWVEYTITLYTPQLVDNIGQEGDFYAYGHATQAAADCAELFDFKNRTYTSPSGSGKSKGIFSFNDTVLNLLGSQMRINAPGIYSVLIEAKNTITPGLDMGWDVTVDTDSGTSVINTEQEVVDKDEKAAPTLYTTLLRHFLVHVSNLASNQNPAILTLVAGVANFALTSYAVRMTKIEDYTFIGSTPSLSERAQNRAIKEHNLKKNAKNDTSEHNNQTSLISEQAPTVPIKKTDKKSSTGNTCESSNNVTEEVNSDNQSAHRVINEILDVTKSCDCCRD